jgi:hypothetical protein
VRTVWTLMLPLLILGETVGPQAAIAIFLALAATVLVRRAIASFQGRPARTLPSWHLAGVPSAALLAQEHLESFLHNGELNWLTVAEPTVLLGAAVQVPCGLLAVWLVRTLLRAADELGQALSRHTARRVYQRPALEIYRGRQDEPLRLLALVRGLAERAPPSFA